MMIRNRMRACAMALCLMLAMFISLGVGPRFGAPFALADEGRELLEVQISAKPAEMVEPGDVMLNFTIVNTSAVDALNVYLSSADGLLSEPFGRIAAGDSQSFNRQHSVTREELDAGEISYIISHDDPFDPTGKVNYTVQAPIRRSDSLPQAEFTRQFSSRYAQPGGTLIVTYRIRNTGNVALTNLRVQDTLGDFTGRVEQLDVGESRTLISRATITEETVSSAALDYSALGMDAVYTCALTEETVRIAQSGLDAQLSAGYSAFTKSVADVVVFLTNTGNVDFRDVRIIDDIHGGVIADSLVIPAGGDPVEVSHAYPVRGDLSFRWRVTGVSDAGERIDFTTNTAALLPLNDVKPAALTISADTDTPRIRRSGDVTVTVRISNGGGTDARDVLLSEATLGPLRRFEIIPADGAVERGFTLRVEQSASYSFTLQYADEYGMDRSVTSAPLEISITPDGVLPDGAASRLIEFTGSSIKIGGSTTFAVLLIMGCVVLLVLVVMLLIASRRARIEKQLRIAAEKQRRKEELGKTNRFIPVRAPKPTSKGKGRSN